MISQPDLDTLYTEATQALKAKEYERAGDLLCQILKTDVDYKDAAQLLARTIRLSRRRWYNDPRLWGALCVLLLIGFGLYFFPKLQRLASGPASSPVILPTDTSAPTISLPATPTATATSLPSPTPIPFTWKRISLGQEFERDIVTAIVIDPKDPEVLYAGMKNASIFKSIDGGLSWRPAHQGLANAHVTSLLVDFQNTQILYTSTMEGIYKTEDGGETWFKTGEGTHVLMDPQDSSHLYARDDGSIYESNDQGIGWKPVYSSQESCPDRIHSWAIHPNDGNSLFTVGGGKCDWGVYESNDNGRSWTLIPLFKFEIPPNANVLDYGVDKLTVGLGGQENLDIHPNETAAYDSKGAVYTYWDDYLYKFDPGTEQRVRMGKPGVGTGITAVTVISISPFDPETIFVGGKGISVSKDGGLTWAKLNNGLGNTVLQLEADLNGAGILYSLPGECERILIRSYEGETIPSQALYRSNDSGSTWDFASETGCHLIKDANGSALYRLGDSDWYSGGAWRGIIWRSQNEGESWDRLTTPNFIQTVVAHPSQPGLLYGFTKNPYYRSYLNPNFPEEEYYYSEDFGETWKKQEQPASTKLCYGSTLQFIDAYRPMAIDPFDGNHVFVIDSGILLDSRDSCETTSAFGTAPNTSMNSIAFDSENPDTLYAGTDGGAYISYDAGTTWGQVNDGLLGATVVYSIVVDKDGNVYAATPYGIFKLESQ